MTDMMTTTSTWAIDPVHTTAEFAVKHLMISTVKGRFADVSGTIVLDESDMSNSVVSLSIPTKTIDTHSEQRDAHLRSADFFDADRVPAITFNSKRVKAKGDNEYEVTGDLTIRDVTREVTLEVSDEGRNQDPWGGTRAGFAASTSIDRADFGLTWNQALETGGFVVSNKVKISVDVEAVRA